MSGFCKTCRKLLDADSLKWKTINCLDCRQKHTNYQSALRSKKRVARDISYIYALIDPRTNSVRYVGYSANLDERLTGHIQVSRYAPHYGERRARWINSLTAIGLKPEIFVLETCTKKDQAKRERYWISLMLKKAQPLTNSYRDMMIGFRQIDEIAY